MFWCKMASTHFDLALDVLVDLISNARFDASDIDNERKVIVEEIRMSIDSPRQRVDMLIDELLWPGHPLGRDIAGTEETVSSIDRSGLIDFFSTYYVPDNIVVSIAGDIEHSMVQDSLYRTIGMRESGVRSERMPFQNEQVSPRLCVEFRDIEQVHIDLGFPGLSLHHQDRFAIDLMNIILGGGMSSRLFGELRERRALAYDVSSYADHFIDTGSFMIYAGVSPQNVELTLQAIGEQLDLLKKTEVSDEDLARAKEMVKGRLLLAFEDSRNVANWLGAQEVLTGKILTIEEVTGFVDQVTAGDIKKVANDLFVHEKINLALVGPVKEEISPTLVLPE
jgi:predicted Zn-dependent peptidase